MTTAAKSTTAPAIIDLPQNLADHSKRFLTVQGFLHATDEGLEPAVVLSSNRRGRSLIGVCREERVATEWVQDSTLFLAEDPSTPLG